jgi:hypothetical protein
MARERDAIEILVSNQIAVLVRLGRDEAEARPEAEAIVSNLLEEMSHLGMKDVYLGVALRRSRVYRMRSGGMTFKVICERLGISRFTADDDYRSEMIRRRTAA